MTTFHKPENFKVGDTWPITGYLSYADGTPFNLGAGCGIQWGLQNATGTVVLELSLGNGISVVDPAGGVCLVTVQPFQSAILAVGSYTDQLQATDPSGYVSTQWQGTINARSSIFV
jgi:hypothetical protein